MRIKDVYSSSLQKIQNRDIEIRSLTLLMESFLGYYRPYEIFEHQNENFPSYEKYEGAFKRLLDGEPVQYILNKAWFYGQEFYVDSKVLIPRMETEELVELIIRDNVEESKLVICDIGTGSGIIAITIAKHLRNATVYASDICAHALAVAKKNAQMHNCDIEFFEGNMLEPFIMQNRKIDIIVSNPPYINKEDKIPDLVKNNEPLLALIPPSGDGIEYYLTILEKAAKVLSQNGKIYFEIGENLPDQLENYLKKVPNICYEFIKDISMKPRILKICFV